MADNNNAPGFTTGNNTVQGQQGGISVGGGQPFDIVQWLKNTLQQTNQGGNTQGGMSIGGQAPQQNGAAVMQGILSNLSQTNPATGLNDNHTKILQSLIDKGTKQQAQDFLNQVGSTKAQQLVDAHNATSPTNTQTQGTQQASQQPIQPQVQPQQSLPNGSTPISESPDAIQEQAHKIALQKPGLLMSIFRGTFQNDNAQQLDNLKTVQTITQGGPPLSPDQKATAIGNWNSALLKQHQDFQSDLSDQMKANVDAQTAFIKNTPLPSKAADWSGYNQKLQEFSSKTQAISDRMTQGFNKYKNLQLTNPVTGKKGSSSPNNQYSGITPDMARQELANRIKSKKGQ